VASATSGILTRSTRSPSVAALAVGAALALAAPGAATVRLALDAEAGPDLRLVAVNDGDETARDVVPELVYQHRTVQGPAAALAPGARHEWHLPLPPPSGPGTFPVTVRVGWAGTKRGIPIVALFSTPGEPPSPVRATVDVAPLGRSGSVKLRLANPGPRAVAGRALLVLPAGLSTEPETIPAQLASGGETLVPFAVENHGLAPGPYPAYAVFEYAEDGAHRATVARADVEVVTRASAEWARRLTVGLAALALALGGLAIAWRAARRPGRS